MAKKDFTVTSKGRSFTVPKGHYIGTSPYVAMHIPEVFKNPDEVSGQGQQHQQPNTHGLGHAQSQTGLLGERLVSRISNPAFVYSICRSQKDVLFSSSRFPLFSLELCSSESPIFLDLTILNGEVHVRGNGARAWCNNCGGETLPPTLHVDGSNQSISRG